MPCVRWRPEGKPSGQAKGKQAWHSRTKASRQIRTAHSPRRRRRQCPASSSAPGLSRTCSPMCGSAASPRAASVEKLVSGHIGGTPARESPGNVENWRGLNSRSGGRLGASAEVRRTRAQDPALQVGSPPSTPTPPPRGRASIVRGCSSRGVARILWEYGTALRGDRGRTVRRDPHHSGADLRQPNVGTRVLRM
jgi:hypothetical protein